MKDEDKYYLIGVGGTGSKCVESFLHLAACRLTPKEVWIGFVDQDKANGNLTRSKQLLSLYQKIYDFLHTGQNELGESPLFSAEITCAKESPVWFPISDEKHNLFDLFNYPTMDSDEKMLFDSLFTKENQTFELNVGFRARPSIGAAVILKQSSPEHAFWRDIFSSIEQLQKGRKVSIFLIASIFGGTGSAGIPNIARMIRRKISEQIDEKVIKNSFRIGGALLLPYFSYPSKDIHGVTAFSDTFLKNTQGALKYYNRLFNSEPTFNSLYFIGWDPLIDLSYCERGGQNQDNPPLIPELYAALACADFFSQSDFTKMNTQLLMGREDSDKLTWQSVPKMLNTKEGHQVKLNLGNLLRFAFTYLNSYYPYLKDNSWIRQIQKQIWFNRLIAGQKVDISDNKIREILGDIEKYCVSMLQWAASISYCMDGIQLFHTQSFADKPKLIDKGLTPILKPEAFHLEHFVELVSDSHGSSLKQIFENLHTMSFIKDTRGLGVFLSALYEAAKIK
jgi:hypothetical protein